MIIDRALSRQSGRDVIGVGITFRPEDPFREGDLQAFQHLNQCTSTVLGI